MIVKFNRTASEARPPRRSNPSDAGADLFSTESCMIHPLERKTIPTGIRLEIPDGYYGRIAPRSGLAAKNGIDVLAGVVDSGYRGEINVVLYNTDKSNTFFVEPGDRIAQIIIERHYNMEFVEVVDELSDTSRGEGGFGSSGK
jgi:dUTP pyrophosphatase